MRFLYHAFSDAPGLNTCSASSDEAPLVVNCAGNIVLEKPFTTDNVVGREDFYLMYIIRGQISVSLVGNDKIAAAGDVLIFPPHVRYRYSYFGGEAIEYLFVHFTGSYAEKLLGVLGLSPLPCLVSTDGNLRVAEAFRTLLECTANTAHLQKYELACLLEAALISVGGNIIEASPTRTFESSLRIIHTAYHSDIRIPDLAKAENLSHSRYVELFKRQMGVSPMAYLVRLRLRAACNLLDGTDIPISRIAQMVGYDDSHFFSKIFKKHMGVSPCQYREKRI